MKQWKSKEEREKKNRTAATREYARQKRDNYEKRDEDNDWTNGIFGRQRHDPGDRWN